MTAVRRYKRRRKVERLFTWLFNFRRLVVRYERYDTDFLGFLHLAWLGAGSKPFEVQAFVAEASAR